MTTSLTATVTALATTTTAAPSNASAYAGPYSGEPIWARPTEGPFVVFVLLSAALIVGTLIAVCLMQRQHDAHLKRINAVRGFHQRDMGPSSDVAVMEASASLIMSPQRAGGRRQVVAAPPPPASPGGAGEAGGDAENGAAVKPTRLMFDFHHTPEQTGLEPPRRGVPALQLGALSPRARARR